MSAILAFIEQIISSIDSGAGAIEVIKKFFDFFNV